MVGGFTALSIGVSFPALPSLPLSSFELLSALAPIRKGLSQVEEEQERARTEQSAFDDFLHQVERIDALNASTVLPAAHSGQVHVSRRSSDQRIAKVKRAYAETVMDVPHFEAEYGESLEENMAMELGEEVTASLLAADRFTPQLKEGLLFGAQRAREERTSILRMVRTERKDLREAWQTLDGLESERSAIAGRANDEFGGCREAYDHLKTLSERCERLLEERQTQIHRQRAQGEYDSLHHLCKYLYEPLGTAYPVLKAGTTVLDRVRQTRRNAFDRLCTSR